MARYMLGQSLAHVKLFIAANMCVKQAQKSREIFGDELGQVNHSQCGWRVCYRVKFKLQSTVSRGKWLYYTFLAGLSQTGLV